MDFPKDSIDTSTSRLFEPMVAYFTNARFRHWACMSLNEINDFIELLR